MQEIQASNSLEKDICFVLHNDTNKVYQVFKQKLDTEYSQLKRSGIFNFIDFSKKEHMWFKHWLCLNSSVITCVFTHSGNLKCLIGGASTFSFEYLEKTLNNKMDKFTYGYKTPLHIDGVKAINVLNDVHKCKIGFEEGKSIKDELESTFKVVEYPYNLYLWLQNSFLNRKKDSLLNEIGQKILAFRKQRQFGVLYSEVFEMTSKLINPEYRTDSLGILSVENKYQLYDCKIGFKKRIRIKLSNIGFSPINIEEVDLGCDCLALGNMYSNTIKTNENVDLDIDFTPKTVSDTIKNIFIVSNASNYIEHIEIKAEIIEK